MKNIYKLELARGFESWGIKFSLFLGCCITIFHWIFSVLPMAFYQDTYMGTEYSMKYPFNVFNNWIGAQTYTFSYLYFFLIPLLVTLPHAGSFSQDIRYRMIQQLCIRVERKYYYRAKYVATFISGGTVAIVPLILNFILTSAVLPMISPQAADYTTLIGMKSTLGDFYFKHPILYICIFLMIIFVFSGILATIAFIAAYYTNHMFIVLTAPFVFSMFLNSLFSMFGLTDWQMVFFLNPAYNGDRILPIIIEGVIIMATTFFIFVINGSKDDIC